MKEDRDGRAGSRLASELRERMNYVISLPSPI